MATWSTSWDVEGWFDESVYDLIASWWGEEVQEHVAAPLKDVEPDASKNHQDRLTASFICFLKAFPNNSLLLIIESCMQEGDGLSKTEEAFGAKCLNIHGSSFWSSICRTIFAYKYEW